MYGQLYFENDEIAPVLFLVILRNIHKYYYNKYFGYLWRRQKPVLIDAYSLTVGVGLVFNNIFREENNLDVFK